METHKTCILILLQAFKTLLKFAWDFIETLLMFHNSTTCHKGFLQTIKQYFDVPLYEMPSGHDQTWVAYLTTWELKEVGLFDV